MAERLNVPIKEFLALAENKKVQEVLEVCRKLGLPQKGADVDSSALEKDLEKDILTRIDRVFDTILELIPIESVDKLRDIDLKRRIDNVEDKSKIVIASLLTAEALKIILCPQQSTNSAPNLKR
jgi:hypothetical protein